MSLYAKAGKAKFAYNFFGLQTSTTEASQTIPTGRHQVRIEFAYDGGGLAKGGGPAKVPNESVPRCKRRVFHPVY
jgi:hypothetical protein